MLHALFVKNIISNVQISEECSMASAGSLITAGSKLGFSLDEPGTSPVLWSISPEGRIHSRSKPNLVLDVKGKAYFKGTLWDKRDILL